MVGTILTLANPVAGFNTSWTQYAGYADTGIPLDSGPEVPEPATVAVWTLSALALLGAVRRRCSRSG